MNPMLKHDPKTFGASKSLRDSLKANYVIVPALSPKISIFQYFKFAKAMYEGAIVQYNALNWNGAYVDFHKFQVLILERLPKHVDYKPDVKHVEELKKWIATTKHKAMDYLEKIVRIMDAEELRKKMLADAKADLDLMDEFDAPAPPPPLVVAVPTVTSPASVFVTPTVAPSVPPVEVSKDFSKLSSLNPYANEVPSIQSTPAITQSAPVIVEKPTAPAVDLYGEVPSIDFSYDGAMDPEPANVDQSLSGLMGLTANDVDILSFIPNYRDFYIPPPTSRLITFQIGGVHYSFTQDDFHVSFNSFLSHIPVELQMAKSALETNRCFFLHLGIATRIHPFVLQTVFRYYTSLDLNQADLWYGDIVSTVNQYAGFVDANALSFLWPEEFDEFVICFISGPTNAPILSCFAPHGREKNLDGLTEIFIRCDGQHFTLIKPSNVRPNGTFKYLSEILEIARRSNMLVQFNEVQPSNHRSVRAAVQALRNS